MIELYPNHHQILKDSLQGTRKVDEQTFESMEVLEERLQQVRQLGDMFSGIEFSPAVERFKTRPGRVAVG